MAGNGHVVLAVSHTGEEGGGVHRLDGHIHTHLGQFLLHEGSQTGAVGGTGQGIGPPVVASLLQQRLGSLHVPLPGQGAGVLRTRSHVGGSGLTQTMGGLKAQCLLIQGQIDGPAHLCTGDGLAVEHQFIKGVGDLALQHLNAPRFGGFSIIHGQVATKGIVIQIAGNEGGQQVGLIDHRHHQLIKVGTAQLIVLVDVQHQLAARDLLHKLAGAGAYRCVPQIQFHDLRRFSVCQQMGGQHIELPVFIQQEVLRGGGALEGELQGVLIHCLRPQLLPRHGAAVAVGACQHGEGTTAQGRTVRVGNEGNGIRPVLGGHRSAVVEGSLFIQVEEHRHTVVGTLPAFSASGIQGTVSVDIGQPVIDLITDNTGIIAARRTVIGHQRVPGIGQAIAHRDLLRGLFLSAAGRQPQGQNGCHQ